MELTIFGKKGTTKEGKVFYRYLTKLEKKDGTEITTAVKFREECGSPRGDKCPMIINVNKKDCNFSSKTVTEVYKDDEGNEEERDYVNNVLWVSAWTDTDKQYVDTSMDDFVD